MFKKAIKFNGEIVEVDISTYLVLLLERIFMNGERTLFKTMQIALLKSWNKHFASDSEM
jgi:hypothetical protein